MTKISELQDKLREATEEKTRLEQILEMRIKQRNAANLPPSPYDEPGDLAQRTQERAALEVLVPLIRGAIENAKSTEKTTRFNLDDAQAKLSGYRQELLRVEHEIKGARANGYSIVSHLERRKSDLLVKIADLA